MTSALDFLKQADWKSVDGGMMRVELGGQEDARVCRDLRDHLINNANMGLERTDFAIGNGDLAADPKLRGHFISCSHKAFGHLKRMETVPPIPTLPPHRGHRIIPPAR